MNGLFSVVIPTYNGMESIGIAIESVARQTYKNIEVIVSDDNGIGSSAQKETKEIVKKFEGRVKIKYIANEHLNGSNARNKGLEIADGEFISLLDDDDFYLDTYIGQSVDFFNKNKDIDFIFFDVAFISREGVSRLVENNNISSKELLFGEKEIGTGSNICFRKNVLGNSEPFDIRYLRYQDIEFVTKKISVHKSMWIKDVKIVKYFNKNENYLNYRKALKMQNLLREDMIENGIISQEESSILQAKQLHTLFNDMLVKNMNKDDIKTVYKMLKEESIITPVNRLTWIVYMFSPSLFNLIYRNISNSVKCRIIDNAAELLELREELKGM